jgi:hypothetical protein
MSRRYERGMHPAYDSSYNRMYVKSWVINQGLRENSINHFLRLTSAESCRAELLRLVGNTKGMFLQPDRNEFKPCDKTTAMLELQEAETQVAEYRRKRAAQGHEDTDTVPDHLLNNVLAAQAAVDIIDTEVRHIRQKMKEFEAQQVKSKPTNVLRLGAGAFDERGDDPLFEIDGQRVGFVGGVLVIVDDRPCYDGGVNPYRGLSVIDYRKMARKWRKEITENYWRRRAVLEQEQRVAEARGESHSGADGIPVPGLHPMPRERWPKWPDGAINHLAKKETKEITAT